MRKGLCARTVPCARVIPAFRIRMRAGIFFLSVWNGIWRDGVEGTAMATGIDLLAGAHINTN